MTATVWLSDDQQQVWRRWLAASTLLPAALQRELQADAGLSLPDYEVLVKLTESPEGRVRVTDLARALSWEKSRASHHLTRMERRGLVAREECREDGRGAFVALTPEGRASIEQAAPGHVRAVRSLVFDDMTDTELEVLGAALGKVLARLQQAPAAAER